ncbi:MAG: spinster family MFS transporter [Croceibacterium sp.]
MTARGGSVPAAAACWTLFLLFLANVLNVGDRMLLGVVTEPVRRELVLSDTQMSLANGFLFVLFNLVAGVFIARLADRGNRVRILAVGIAAWSLSTAATGLAHSFPVLALARVGVGIGEATAFPAVMSLIPDLFRPQVRGRAVAAFQSSSFVGIVGGTVLAGVLAASLGWRAMFLVCGIAGVVLATILVLSVREPVRETPPDPAEDNDRWLAGLRTGLRRVVGAPGFAALAVGFGISAMMGAVLGAWGPAFLQRTHGVPLHLVGIVIGPAVGIGGLAGTLISGAMADRLVRRHGSMAAMLRVPLVALPLSTPFMAGFVFAPSLFLTMCCAAVMNFLLSCAFVPCVNFAVTRADPGDRALASTVMLASSGLIGGALGPFLVGLLSDGLTPQFAAEGLRYALSSMIVTPILATGFLIVAVRNASGTPVSVANLATNASGPVGLQ